MHENLAKVYRLQEILPVIDVTPATMEIFGEVKADLQRRGTTVPDLDLMIGATGLTMGYRIVTNNEKHFTVIPGVTTENWSA